MYLDCEAIHEVPQLVVEVCGIHEVEDILVRLLACAGQDPISKLRSATRSVSISVANLGGFDVQHQHA